MRNFISNKLRSLAGRIIPKEIAEILDTDEDRVINQYKGYLNYINNIKKELIRRSTEIVGYQRKRLAS